VQRFVIKKLNDVESKEQYRLEISNRFPAVENLNVGVDNTSTLEKYCIEYREVS
jgi:hypothetical protein